MTLAMSETSFWVIETSAISSRRTLPPVGRGMRVLRMSSTEVNCASVRTDSVPEPFCTVPAGIMALSAARMLEI